MSIIYIIGWILWGLAILLAFSFSLNARSLIANGGKISSTEFGVALLEGFLFYIVAIIFYFSTLNKLHLIWVIPIIYFGSVSLLLPGIPFISPLLARISLKIFAPLVLIGIVSNAERKLKSEMEEINTEPPLKQTSLPENWKELLHECNFLLARKEMSGFLALANRQAKQEGKEVYYRKEFVQAWEAFANLPNFETAVAMIEDAPEYAEVVWTYLKECCPGGRWSFYDSVLGGHKKS